MLKPEDKITLTNRSGGSVLYVIDDGRTRREFNSHEKREVNCGELMEVAAQDGGRELLYNYFFIDSPEFLEEILNVKPEVEYNISEADLPNFMKTCSLDQFKDALDFAPDGIKNLIKQFAVSMPLTDTTKIEAIKEQLGFDCETAIKNEKATEEDEEKVENRSGRRVQSTPIETTPARRATEEGQSKYKVVNKS